MSFFKKYGLYFAIILVTTVLGTAGYITESRKERAEKQKEITYVPKVITEEEETKEVLSVPPQKKAEAVPTVSSEPEKTVFVRPVKSEVTLPFDKTKMIYSETMDDFRTHEGADYICNVGEKITAAADGEVTSVYTDDFLGLCVEITHDGNVITRYCGLEKAKKKQGEKAAAGEIIATAGNSTRIESAAGVHLHLEAERDGEKINPEELFDVPETKGN